MKGIVIDYHDILLNQISQTEHYGLLTSWYNDFTNYGLATGNTRYCSVVDMVDVVNRIQESPNEFLCGVYSKNLITGMIGYVKSAVYKEESQTPVFWIKSLVIDEKYRRMGFGSKVVNAIELYLKRSIGSGALYVSVSEQNKIGIAFWEKNRYKKTDINRTGAVIDKKGVAILYKSL